MNADQARTTILQSVSAGETLLWFGHPTAHTFRDVSLGCLGLAAVIKFIYLDGHMLLFGTFPSKESNIGANIFLVFLWFVILVKLLRRPRRARRVGQSAFALTDKRLMIVRKGEIQSLDRLFFQALGNIKVVRSKDLVFEFFASADDAGGTKVTLYGVRDPFRVACLIRCTLAHHTLTRNLEGATV